MVSPCSGSLPEGLAMSSMQHLGLTWPVLAERVERSGRWPSLVIAEPALACVSGLQEVAAIAADRDHPGDADALLGRWFALARWTGVTTRTLQVRWPCCWPTG